MFPGRFWFAAGSGEALNEHITGAPWPPKADAARHAAWIAEYADLGFDAVFVHNVGVAQRAFIDAYADRVLPELVPTRGARPAAPV